MAADGGGRLSVGEVLTPFSLQMTDHRQMRR
jgi:hypothetical protein